ncbi:MAG: SDR family oxidoreductase [Bacteroidetes bacterium]|nr:MAG: SDR family oxidoreductase [Bacteroidota bacterium]
MSSNLILDRKVCIVTGASRGIGLAIAIKFVKEGALVFANARNAESLSDDLASAEKHYPNLTIQYYDVTKSDEVKSAILEVKKLHGRIDVLVNNAGIVSYELVALIDFERFHQMLETNVVAVLRITQLVSRIMARQNSGSIINISSIVSTKGVKGQVSYAATKGAINAITIAAAKEFAEHTIRVNAVAPGMVGTERLLSIMGEKFQHKENDIGFGRVASPEEVADVCLFLASDMSSFVTGQIIGVDGSTIM